MGAREKGQNKKKYRHRRYSSEEDDGDDDDDSEDNKPDIPHGPTWIDGIAFRREKKRNYRRSYYPETQGIKPPLVKLPIFTGKAGEWPTFRDTFKIVVDETVRTDFERMLHLNNHLSKDLQNMMGPLLRDSKQYQAALQWLEAAYGG